MVLPTHEYMDYDQRRDNLIADAAQGDPGELNEPPICQCGRHYVGSRWVQRNIPSRGHPTPRLALYMKWVAILSDGETWAAIRDQRLGYQYSSEAVNHFGGTQAVITRAIAMRHALRDMWAREAREYRAGYRKVTWADVKEGDTVWIDNHEDGKYPHANPQISGPYTVHHQGNRTLRTTGRRFDYPFGHYPNNLLVKENQ